MFDLVHSLLSSQKQSNTETVRVRTQSRVSTNGGVLQFRKENSGALLEKLALSILARVHSH